MGSPSVQFSDPVPRSALGELLLLAMPSVVQMSAYTLMAFVDTWMLSHVSDVAATAAGGASMFAWTFLSFGMGVLFLVNTLASQSFGRRDLPEAGRFLWQGIWFSLLYTPVVTVLTLGLPAVFVRMGHSAQLVAAESTFLQIIIIASPLKLVATACGQFLIAINRPNAVLVAAIGGVGVNFVLAGLLVRGWFGSPTLGIAGAAISQTIGTGVEMVVLLCIAWSGPIRAACRLGDIGLYWREFRTLLRVGLPSGVQTITEMLAWALFVNWVVAGLGQAALSADVYLFRFMLVSFLPAVGLASAVTALVGRYIGSGEPARAARSAHLGFAVTACYMTACGACFFIFRRHLMGVFSSDPEVLRIGGVLLIFAAFYQLFDAMYAIYNGALRGAGDTTVPAITMGVLCWLLNVLAARWMADTFPQWGVAGPWSMALLYGISIGLFLLIRFSRGRWKLIHLDEPAAASKLTGFPLDAGEQ